ncbi:DUF2608 domain-containing protein [Candidatus Berkiella aquae]|uniref:DUF2608 domain-containing protein n=1 Tax=Candidatus Berkiella aquae TaxID=295108 RepID=A0A0Q9YB89_9GAMM|nr:DUF2608 domain-containing protein [Candidatus Berkiella aquae]MCS5710614.1 DUF2608 domain-containing protein [Candidatus Berkiella aquae]
MPKPKTLKQLSKSNTCKIFETDQFSDGAYFLEKHASLFPQLQRMGLFDLDNTLVSYRHTLCTDQWFDFDLNEFMKQGYSVSEAKNKTLSFYLEAIRKIHPEDIYVVEESTPALIDKLQQMGVHTLALTSRGSLLLQETIAQLAMFKINFNQGYYGKLEDKVLPQSAEGLFTKGLVLASGQHKGECLLTAIAAEKKLPDLIVMWDDKLSNLEKVRDSIERYNQQKMPEDKTFVPVKFIGIRYSRLDHVVNQVNPNVLELQRKYLQRILSDEHAAMIDKAEQKKQRQHHMTIDCQLVVDMVTVSCHKYVMYEKLLSLYPDLHACQTVGNVKEFNGKKKLAWRFQFTLTQFEPIYLSLKEQHLISFEQCIEFDFVFNQSKTLTPLYEHEASDNQAKQAGLAITQQTVLDHKISSVTY